MRIPLTPYGLKELLLYGGGTLLLAAACFPLGVPWLAVVPGFLFLFVLSFFRDFDRKIPGGEGVIVSPADGKIDRICEVEDEEFIGGRALRIDIFLAVYSVHVNRMPLAGEVQYTAYEEGVYRNAINPDCAEVNQNRTIGMIADDGGFRVVVRQIVGAIARRIVSPVSEGDRFARGERFGMIKFGSRTQFSIAADVPFEVKVSVGDRVKGGATVLGIARPGGDG